MERRVGGRVRKVWFGLVVVVVVVGLTVVGSGADSEGVWWFPVLRREGAAREAPTSRPTMVVVTPTWIVITKPATKTQ